jgi:DNA-binding NtrC family response regulator
MDPTIILLISRDAEIERAASDAARRTGHTLSVARTAHQAVKEFMYGFDRFGLILLDLDADIHGVTLFNAMDDCHGKAPVVALTGCEESYMKPLVLGRGAAACLGKPVTAPQLKRLIEEFCIVLSTSKPYDY